MIMNRKNTKKNIETQDFASLHYFLFVSNLANDDLPLYGRIIIRPYSVTSA